MAKSTPMATAELSAPGATANAILQIATKPDRQSPQYAAWIEQQDFLEFLRARRRSEDVVLYAGLTHCFLYSIAVPSSAVTAVDVDDLLGWNCTPFSTWGLCHGYRDDRIYPSWERGLNKNSNGLLRQYFRKGMEWGTPGTGAKRDV